EESLAISRAIGDTPCQGYALARLGNLASSDGDYVRADELYHEGLKCFREVMDRRQLATCLSFRGSLAIRRGSSGRGVRLCAAAEAADHLYRTSLDPVERADGDDGLALARAALGDEAFARAWSDGHGMNLDQAIALGLSNDPRDG